MVAAQLWSARLASGCTRWCNCGEALSASVHKKAAETTPVRRARRELCKRADLFIALRSSDSVSRCASNFPGSAHASRAVRGASPRTLPTLWNTQRVAFIPPIGERANRCTERRVRSLETAVSQRMLIARFPARCDSRLEGNTVIGRGSFRRCAGADLFRPFGVLVVWVLI